MTTIASVGRSNIRVLPELFVLGMRKSIAIDMDEVMADALGKLVRLYETEYQITVDRERLQGRFLAEAIDPTHAHVVREYLLEKEFFTDLEIMVDSQEVVRALSEQYDVFIVTAAMGFPDSFRPKYDWLIKHFPFLSWRNFIFCGDKHVIGTDYLIDDMPYNLESFSGKPIIFTSPHNVHETRFTRVNDWQDVKQFFLS